MGRDTAVIVAFVGALLLLSPFILFFTIAVFDTLGIDRMLPDPLFYIIAPPLPHDINLQYFSACHEASQKAHLMD